MTRPTGRSRTIPTWPGGGCGLIEPLGLDGDKRIVNDYLREVQRLFVTPRTHQRTVIDRGRSASSTSSGRR
jgi:hypothetical protein